MVQVVIILTLILADIFPLNMLLFVSMLYIPVNNLQSCLDDFMSTWVEPVLRPEFFMN